MDSVQIEHEIIRRLTDFETAYKSELRATVEKIPAESIATYLLSELRTTVPGCGSLRAQTNAIRHIAVMEELSRQRLVPTAPEGTK